MKPSPFEYRAPSSIRETVEILDKSRLETKVLAGGQSLVPAMNFRLARPEVLLDINGITELQAYGVDEDRIRIGALTRHAELERWSLPGPVGNLIRRAARWVGHLPVRVRGTFGGSLSHADPAAEWPLVALALDATLVAVGPKARREIAAPDFFLDAYTTALAPNELLTETVILMPTNEIGVGFAEISRRAGDFALVAAAAVVELRDGVVAGSRIALGGVGPIPILVEGAQEALLGQPLRYELLESVAEHASLTLNPLDDIHASSSYKRSLAQAVIHRCLLQASEGS